MSENKFRDRMGEIIDENLDEILDDGKDHSEEIDKIMNDFRISTMEKRKKKAPGILKRFGMIAAIVAVLFIGSVMLSDVPIVRALRVNVENFFDKLTSPDTIVDDTGTIVSDYSSIEEAEAGLGALPLTLGWVPDGYELNNIQAITNNYDDQIIYSYDYYNSNKSPVGYISISITNSLSYGNASDSDYNTGRSNLPIIEINGIEVALSDETPPAAHFVYNNVYEVTIVSDLDTEDLTKLIENIK